jgi:hypothetical protein
MIEKNIFFPKTTLSEMFANVAFYFFVLYMTLLVFIESFSSNQTLREKSPIKQCSNRKTRITPLDKYVFDDDDLNYLNYEVMSIWNSSKYTTYKLNATTLKWFDGKNSNSMDIKSDYSFT